MKRVWQRGKKGLLLLMFFLIVHHLTELVSSRTESWLGAASKKKVVLLGGAPLVVVKAPLFLWEIFHLLRIPWYGKIIEQIGNWNFHPSPTSIRPSQKTQSKSSKNPTQDRVVLLCFYTFWRLLHRMEAEIKSGTFLAESWSIQTSGHTRS